MTTCDNCGSQVTPGDTFCGVCGAYLDWSSPAPASPVPDPSAQTTAPASTTPASRDQTTTPASTTPATASGGSTPDASVVPVPAGPGATTGPTTGSPAPVLAPLEAAASSGANEEGTEQPVSHRDGHQAAKAESGWPSRNAVAGASATDADQPDPAVDDGRAETASGQPDPAVAPARETDSDRRSRAAALVVPVSEAGPPVAVPARDVAVDPVGRDRPGAVQPGRPVAPRPALREFVDEQADSQLICPHCGTANPADRIFCRRCGRSLAGAVAQRKDRRRWRFRRPRGRGRLWRLLAFLLALALLVGAGWAAVHWGPRAVDAILDRLATAEATTPNATSASSSARNHGPGLVADGLSNRYWSPTSGRGAGEWVELRFDRPIRVLDLIVSGGVSADQAEYLERGRPADILVSTWTSDGVRTDNRFRLADRAGPQPFALTAGDTTRLRVTVESGYALGPGRAPAIAEIEVFRRP